MGTNSLNVPITNASPPALVLEADKCNKLTGIIVSGLHDGCLEKSSKDPHNKAFLGFYRSLHLFLKLICKDTISYRCIVAFNPAFSSRNRFSKYCAHA